MNAGPLIPDYHIHTRFSDGHEGLEDNLARAAQLGLPEIGFADHLAPACLAEDALYGRDAAWLDDYVAAVPRAAGAYPKLRVLLGVEAEYLPGAAEETLATLACHPFDYVLCSVHYVDGFSYDEPDNREAEGWRDVDRLWRRYYETLLEAIQTGAFDVIAHLDFPKLWGFRPTVDLSAPEDEVLLAIAAAGMAIGINTSGLDRYPVAEMFPSTTLLGRARQAGIPITFGSDAHHVAHVAANFAEAIALARQAGYESYLRLSDRQLVTLP
jgi:histidinol-phosphatase (PHP family)